MDMTVAKNREQINYRASFLSFAQAAKNCDLWTDLWLIDVDGERLTEYILTHPPWFSDERSTWWTRKMPGEHMYNM